MDESSLHEKKTHVYFCTGKTRLTFYHLLVSDLEVYSIR